jgi:hypothetical protein
VLSVASFYSRCGSAPGQAVRRRSPLPPGRPQGLSPRTVQEILGHSTYYLTATVYGHVAPELSREAAHPVEHVALSARARANRSSAVLWCPGCYCPCHRPVVSCGVRFATKPPPNSPGDAKTRPSGPGSHVQFSAFLGGEGGIRTPGTSKTHNGFRGLWPDSVEHHLVCMDTVLSRRTTAFVLPGAVPSDRIRLVCHQDGTEIGAVFVGAGLDPQELGRVPGSHGGYASSRPSSSWCRGAGSTDTRRRRR